MVAISTGGLEGAFVRFGSLADMTTGRSAVRFYPDSGHRCDHELSSRPCYTARMCGRFTNRLTWREIVALYRLSVPAEPERNLPARYNICPTPQPTSILLGRNLWGNSDEASKQQKGEPKEKELPQKK